MRLTIEFDREADGRWIASVPELAGVHVYGESQDIAQERVLSLALTVLADEVANGERDARTLLTLTFEPRVAA
jgi:predicted RNase H-like HicB family nuclease